MKLSDVINFDEVNCVDQLVPSDLAAILRRQKAPFETKAQIANNPNHTHAPNAATQLADDRGIWSLTALFIGIKADADGCTDCPPMTKTPYEMLTSKSAGDIS